MTAQATDANPSPRFEPRAAAMTKNGRTLMMDPVRRALLATGAAATAMATAPRVFAQQGGQGEAAMSMYEKGDVRIHFEEAGSGFPLLVIAGGGLNSTIAGLSAPSSPFDPMVDLKGEYRCIAVDLRNANPGQSSGPLEVDRPWDSHTDDHLGLMDHLGIDKFMVLGFCIGGPLAWNLIKRAPDRVAAAVMAQPSGSRPDQRDLFYDGNMKNWGPELVKRRPEITMETVDKFLTRMYRTDPDRVYCEPRLRAPVPDAGADPAGRYPAASLCRRHGGGDAGAEGRSEHVPVERSERTDTAGRAPDPFLPPGAPAGFRLS
jgi:pimeloyl-ACP methyl ester carboxylesterase